MTTDVLLGLILAASIISTVWTLSRLDALRDDIAAVERLVRRVADELDAEMDEDGE